LFVFFRFAKSYLSWCNASYADTSNAGDEEVHRLVRKEIGLSSICIREIGRFLILLMDSQSNYLICNGPVTVRHNDSLDDSCIANCSPGCDL